MNRWLKRKVVFSTYQKGVVFRTSWIWNSQEAKKVIHSLSSLLSFKDDSDTAKNATRSPTFFALRWVCSIISPQKSPTPWHTRIWNTVIHHVFCTFGIDWLLAQLVCSWLETYRDIQLSGTQKRMFKRCSMISCSPLAPRHVKNLTCSIWVSKRGGRGACSGRWSATKRNCPSTHPRTKSF